VNDLVIRSGGAIAVDTLSLRAVAVAMRGVAGEAEAVVRDTHRARALLDVVGALALPVQTDAVRLAASAARAADDARGLGEALDRSAELYETVELVAQRRAAVATGDAVAVSRIDVGLAAMPAWARRQAERLVAQGADRSELLRQALVGGVLLGAPLAALMPGLLIGAPGAAADALGRGRIAAGERLRGTAEPVVVTPVGGGMSRAPASLAEAARRIPGGGEARVRVERYEMRSGAVQYAVYIAGTQSFAGRDAFDMAANVRLYGGERSASYEATVRALEEAGAKPGDVVHTFGHSQGAMIGERLALEGPYAVQTVVSFGSPVQADVGDGTLALTVRHTDDPVAALQSGGHPGGVGAPASLVVERTVDPVAGVHDLGLPAHQMSAYVETAEMLDASSDPRVDDIRGVFARLAEAERVDAVDYGAERISPSGAGGR
jgi:pimeloyl-ACP methyl ester carboxylesterase